MPKASTKFPQASIDIDSTLKLTNAEDGKVQVVVCGGDHAVALRSIIGELETAIEYAANDLQKHSIRNYINSFKTGNLNAYREALRDWVKDTGPRVENIFGFVEPYRDPHGSRAEFEGLVGISDPEEGKILERLVQQSDKYIKLLPWVPQHCDDKGPFEKQLFEPPDLSSIHVLAYCSSIIFPGINLPNYNDLRQECGFKNVIVANRMIAENDPQSIPPFIHESERKKFSEHKYPAYYWWVVLHELFGHGTGQMMLQTGEESFNFDAENPPINPMTNAPIKSWYKPGQTWTGQFGDLATTVDECRAELVGAYLMDNQDLLALFGFTTDTEITAWDITCNIYLQLGCDGLRGLSNFNTESNTWGQAHSRAHYAIMRCLLRDSQETLIIDADYEQQRLTVKVDQSKILSHAKPALGRMLLRLHMYRVTAQVAECRAFYEELTQVDGQYLQWREIVLANKSPPLLCVHANTFREDETVCVKEYEASLIGIIQSWAERAV